MIPDDKPVISPQLFESYENTNPFKKSQMRNALIIVPVLVIAAVLFGFYQANGSEEKMEEIRIDIESLVEIPPMPPRDTFGFVTENLGVVDSEIGRNESLYIILRRHGVSPQTIHNVQQRARGEVNLNRLIPGQSYRIYKNENDEAFAFAWQQSPTSYVTISWDNDIEINSGSVPIERRQAASSGVVASSLYEAIRGQGVSSRLGIELAEIFGWEVDFFSLRRGDHFKAVYDNTYANGNYLGIGKVYAAEFQHRGRTHRAYYFDNGERRGFFDEEGNSMERALLRVPFEYNQRISSGFSRNRFHPILRENRPHYGTDYAAPEGTPIIAVADGIVTEAQRRGGNGNIVQIRHNGTYRTAYLHLSRFGPGIRRGVEVKQGQVIGYVGQTGLATGPHLCYRLYVNDQPVNSVRADLPASDGLEEEYMDELRMIVAEMNEKLDEMLLGEESLASN